jgi:hypothetical protein
MRCPHWGIYRASANTICFEEFLWVSATDLPSTTSTAIDQCFIKALSGAGSTQYADRHAFTGTCGRSWGSGCGVGNLRRGGVRLRCGVGRPVGAVRF